MKTLPENVKIYTTKHGSKIHLQPICAGNAIEDTIHETEFLEKLEKGEGCKSCITQPEMINFLVNHLQRKKGNWLSQDRIFIGCMCPRCRRILLFDDEVDHTKGVYKAIIPLIDDACPICGHEGG